MTTDLCDECKELPVTNCPLGETTPDFDYKDNLIRKGLGKTYEMDSRDKFNALKSRGKI